MAELETQLGDIQGNILRAYGFPCARYEILRIVDGAGARRLLGRVLDRQLVTSAATWDPQAKPDATLNVFLSWAGLAALGLPAASLDSFPEEFRSGMAARASILGDVGLNDPATWEFGREAGRTHVFFAVYGRTPQDRERRLEMLRAELAQVGAAVEPTHSLDAELLAGEGEHFGFADGIGQPAIEGSGAVHYPGEGTPTADEKWAPLKAGEFVLGWKGEAGTELPMPQPAALGRNGSFLVYRKLHQDVAAFETFLREQAARLYGGDGPNGVERLAAQLVGRWRSGCPLALSPKVDDKTLAKEWARNNDFRYAGDPDGTSCPLGAHVRRMNPRDGLDKSGDTLVRTHRIVRRGLPYGPRHQGHENDGVDRGVAFMAINASIRYQFEFLQSEWLHNGEFAGLSAGDVDPLSGEPRDGSRFRIQSADAAPRNLFDLPRFVTLRGGGYFFVPSLTALRFLADLQG